MQHHRTVRDAEQGRVHNGQSWKDGSRLIKLRLTASIHFSQSFKNQKILTEASLQVQSSLDLPQIVLPWGARAVQAGSRTLQRVWEVGGSCESSAPKSSQKETEPLLSESVIATVWERDFQAPTSTLSSTWTAPELQHKLTLPKPCTEALQSAKTLRQCLAKMLASIRILAQLSRALGKA